MDDQIRSDNAIFESDNLFWLRRSFCGTSITGLLFPKIITIDARRVGFARDLMLSYIWRDCDRKEVRVRLTSIVLVDCSLHPQSERIEGQSMG